MSKQDLEEQAKSFVTLVKLACKQDSKFETLEEACKDNPLLVNYYDDESDRAPLHHVCEKERSSHTIERQVKVINLLIKYGAKPDSCVVDKWTALHYAARNQLYECCRALIIAGGANVNSLTKEGEAPLVLLFVNLEALNTEAATSTMKVLIEAGADLKTQTQDGDTLLHLSGKHGAQMTMIQLLVNAMAHQGILSDVLNMTNKKGETPLLGICRHRKLGKDTARNRRDSSSFNPLDHFIQNGSSWDEENDEGQNCLHIAVQRADVDLVKALMERAPHLLERGNPTPYKLATRITDPTKATARAAIIEFLTTKAKAKGIPLKTQMSPSPKPSPREATGKASSTGARIKAEPQLRAKAEPRGKAISTGSRGASKKRAASEEGSSSSSTRKPLASTTTTGRKRRKKALAAAEGDENARPGSASTKKLRTEEEEIKFLKSKFDAVQKYSAKLHQKAATVADHLNTEEQKMEFLGRVQVIYDWLLHYRGRYSWAVTRYSDFEEHVGVIGAAIDAWQAAESRIVMG